MKVISEMRRAHYILYLHLYCYHWVDTSSGAPFVPDSVMRPVISISALTWFIKYIHY
jgi:hypothetical protein